LAIGTSIPDLISSIIVAKKWHGNMSTSNALWSNIFDILFGLWFVYFIYFLINGTDKIIIVDRASLLLSIGLLFWSVLLVLFWFLAYKRKLKKWLWWILIAIYISYIIFNVLGIYGIV
jgi:Ca2+/Na+ antiporter